MKKNKIIALIIALVMVMALVAACGPAADDGDRPATGQDTQDTPPAAAPGEGGGMELDAPVEGAALAEHIDVIIDNNPIAVVNPFNPASNPTSTSWVFVMVHDRLIERDHSTGEFVPSLAHNWRTEDYQTFVFYLRDDVYFHNGQQFTADDVIFTVEYGRETGVGSLGFARWSAVDTMTAIDPFTLEIVLNNVNVDFYHDIAHPPASILSRTALEADSATGHHIGTGPYVIRELIPGDFVTMDMNENFWNERFDPQTQTVTLRFIPEPAARTTRLWTGDTHISFSTSADDIYRFQALPNEFNVIGHTFNTMQGFSMNLADPVLQCWHLRMAIMHATNRSDVALFAANEWAVNVLETDRGGGTIWGHSMDFRNNDIPGVDFNLEMAAYHLAQSDYNGEEIEIAAAIITNVRAAQAMQEQLRVAGITARVIEFDSPGLNAHMADNPTQIVWLALNNTLAAGSIRTFFHSESAMNRMRMNFNNPAVDEMLDRAATTLDINERRAIYMEVQELLAADPAFCIVFWRINGVVAHAGIGGVVLPADNVSVDLREIFFVTD
ncbi:MAG: ABC transporter substrate-binding protein [Oscillospiraceae bacterium]|nr:ABC transporter substrate-binding protein [Oscillospiraceae bacterium]